jgi:hypothetical protein
VPAALVERVRAMAAARVAMNLQDPEATAP